MLEPLDEHNLRDHLTAFADGELDAAQSAAVWAFLADRPEGAVLRWLADQKRLTLAARRALDVATPLELRDRITAMMGSDEPPIALPIIASRRWQKQTGYALAIAAAVAIGVTIIFFTARPATPVAVLPADLIVSVGRVHAECSRLPEHLHDARFEQIDPRLAELTEADLGTKNGAAVAAPDLTAVGFRFVGAGPCPASTFNTVHLLYRSIRPLGLAAVSLFVQSDAGQFPAMTAGRVYRVSSSTSPFPMLAWRSGKAIYFLLADDDRTESRVLQSVHPVAAESIITVAE